MIPRYYKDGTVEVPLKWNYEIFTKSNILLFSAGPSQVAGYEHCVDRRLGLPEMLMQSLGYRFQGVALLADVEVCEVQPSEGRHGSSGVGVLPVVTAPPSSGMGRALPGAVWLSACIRPSHRGSEAIDLPVWTVAAACVAPMATNCAFAASGRMISCRSTASPGPHGQ